MSASTATCGCCSGVAQHTPLEVENRPGLSAIAYRVGVHGDFLASMIAALTDDDRPRLADLGTRDRDDFSIALLDAWAVASRRARVLHRAARATSRTCARRASASRCRSSGG